MFELLDIIGTLVFAISGALTAIYKKLDLFGVYCIAFVTALGGGTVRDVLIGRTPVGWMLDIDYVYIITTGFLLSIIFNRYLERLRISMFLFDTIEGNAILKANYVTEKYGFDCFADDTGLEVDALNGAPGVYSARYAGEQKDANDNMDKLLSELKDESNRKANFKTVIALNLNGKQNLFTGIINGKIIEEKIGTNGFGYDPIFVADGFDKTFAELSMEEKSTISHRGIAVKELILFLQKLNL